MLSYFKRNFFNKYFLFSILFCVLLGIDSYKRSSGYGVYGVLAYVITGPGTYKSDFDFLYYILNPFFIAAVSTRAFFEDINSNYCEAVIGRVGNRKKYFRNIYLTSMITGGIVSILPILIGVLMLVVKIPYIPVDPFVLPLSKNLFTVFLNTSPTAYILVSMIPFFLYGMMIALFTMVLKIFIRSQKNIEMAIPFILVMFIELCDSFANIDFFQYFNYYYSGIHSIFGIILDMIIPLIVFSFVYYWKVIKNEVV